MTHDRSRRDAWSIAYRGVSIWSYLRTNYHGQGVTAFHPRWRFGWRDVAGLMAFLTLPLNARKTVVACLNRPDVLSFVRHALPSDSYVLFLRAEVAQGNSFFIEAIRMAFRQWARLFQRAEVNAIMAELRAFDGRHPWKEGDVLAAIGDYHYNRWLRCCLRGKAVYYTNCIVPRIEKHMGAHQSFELQHGIIHKDHLDYADVPRNVIKNGLMVWDATWQRRLISEFHYGGDVRCASFDFSKIDVGRLHEVIIYSTVSDEFSRMIDSYRPVGRVALQLHPRDYFRYAADLSSRYQLIQGSMPGAARYVIISDSTLILGCVASQVYFFYLRQSAEDPAEVQDRLQEKYGARHLDHYEIVDSLEAAFSRLACIERQRATAQGRAEP